jgi:hypothetical protein
MSMVEVEEPMLDEVSIEGEDPGDKHITEILTESCWLYYGIFSGCGFAPSGTCCDPCCLSTYKYLCCEGYVGTTGCCTEQEGLCMGFEKICCLVQASAFPPGGSKGDGLPCVACCNYRCGGEADSLSDLEEVPTETKLLLEKTFLLTYCCCSGIGCLNSGPMCKGTFKFCCLHGNHETSPCCGENGCCYMKSKMCCFVSAGACPPGGGSRDGIPICACCGTTCGGEDEKDYAEESESDEAPEQEMM